MHAKVAASLKNDTVSGLLNASFGNAVEMIVSIQAISPSLCICIWLAVAHVLSLSLAVSSPILWILL